MNNYKDEIELISQRLDRLTQFESCSYDKLLEAERYSVTAGGKHLRGLILLETAKLGGVSTEKSVDYACALEMVHTYSLIHDDLPEMDNDDLRRGIPTCHVKYGEALALLAGDALLTKAFSVIASNRDFTDNKKIECIRVLSDFCGEHGMLAGQTIDKLSENKIIDEKTLIQLNLRKTADMFCAAVRMGAVLADIDSKTEAELIKGMNALGLAFQIKDDILDVTSSSDCIGKPVKSDEKCRKSTFISLKGIENSRELLNSLIEEAKAAPVFKDNRFFYDLAEFFANRTK